MLTAKKAGVLAIESSLKNRKFKNLIAKLLRIAQQKENRHLMEQMMNI